MRTVLTMLGIVNTVRITWTVSEFSATRNTIANFFILIAPYRPLNVRVRS